MKKIILADDKLNKLVDEITERLVEGHAFRHGAISGEEIAKFAPHQQVNQFVLFRIYQDGNTYLQRLNHPYFNFVNEDVKAALGRFFNVLSGHIRVREADFRKLLRQAVYNNLKLILNPEDAIGNFFFGTMSGIPVSLYRKHAPYFSDFDFVIRALDRYYEKNNLLRAEKDVFIQKFNRVLEIYEQKQGKKIADYQRALFKELTGKDMAEVVGPQAAPGAEEEKKTADEAVAAETPAIETPEPEAENVPETPVADSETPATEETSGTAPEAETSEAETETPEAKTSEAETETPEAETSEAETETPEAEAEQPVAEEDSADSKETETSEEAPPAAEKTPEKEVETKPEDTPPAPEAEEKPAAEAQEPEVDDKGRRKPVIRIRKTTVHPEGVPEERIPEQILDPEPEPEVEEPPVNLPPWVERPPESEAPKKKAEAPKQESESKPEPEPEEKKAPITIRIKPKPEPEAPKEEPVAEAETPAAETVTPPRAEEKPKVEATSESEATPEAEPEKQPVPKPEAEKQPEPEPEPEKKTLSEMFREKKEEAGTSLNETFSNREEQPTVLEQTSKPIVERDVSAPVIERKETPQEETPTPEPKEEVQKPVAETTPKVVGTETPAAEAQPVNQPPIELFTDRGDEEGESTQARVKTIAEELAEKKKETTSVGSAFKSIKTEHIPVHKQFQFVQKVFGGSSVKFKVVLDKINKTNNVEEAQAVLEKYVFNDPNVNRNDKVSKEFELLVKNRFV